MEGSKGGEKNTNIKRKEAIKTKDRGDKMQTEGKDEKRKDKSAFNVEGIDRVSLFGEELCI